MHWKFAFNPVQILWTITFAAELVLLVVLLGRDRARRFPWFTLSIALAALKMLITRLLFGKMSQIALGWILIPLADGIDLVALAVLIEIARIVFRSSSRRAWVAAFSALVMAGAATLALWGAWPDTHMFTPLTQLAMLELGQLAALKLGLFADVLTIGLGLLVMMMGRRYGSGLRSHAQQIMIGLSTVSLAQIGVQIIWQLVVKAAGTPHSLDEYQHTLDIKDKLVNANSAVYALVLLWWIACLWIEQPAAASAADAALPSPDAAPAASAAQTEAKSI